MSLSLVRLLLGLALLFTVLGGCGGDDSPSPDDLPGVEPTGITVGGEFSASVVGGEGWPDAIPDDISVLPGEITSVMAGESHVRLFYSGLTNEIVTLYLTELEAQGYDLEFIVYSTPASEERAQERAEAGEWDAVRAVYGGYSLSLAYGAGTGTLDITGIAMEGFGPETSWPEEWSGIPAPSQLPIVEVTRFGPGPVVEVMFDTDADVEQYEDELVAAGFTVTERSFNQNDQIISITVSNGRQDLTMSTYPGGRLEISVTETTSTSHADTPGVVTKDFPEWLPEVPGGDLVFATEDPGGGFTATVVIGDGHTVAEYVAMLEAAGYTESDTMLSGYILSNDERTITIYGNDDGFSPPQITIQVTAN